MSQSTIVFPTDEGMSGFTIGDLGVFIGTLGGVITSILIVLQKSKCRKINCCCLKCERDIEITEPQKKEDKKEDKKEIEELEDKQKKKEEPKTPKTPAPLNPPTKNQIDEIHLTDEEDEGLEPPNP